MTRPVPFYTTQQVRDTCLCLHLQRAARLLARRFDDALRPYDLTNQQFSLLMALNRPEPPPLGPVADLLGIDRTTLTAAVKPLVRRGFVKVLPNPRDARSRSLHLTRRGEVRLAAAVPTWRRVHAELERQLDNVTPQALRRGLAALGEEPG
ncbi:MAG TPA: MarR family transcriptional regulator [Steroidobacteraceae bacterium]|nr:MarR family transcriptional regulator [Steroidobacteraceae bacterium]